MKTGGISKNPVDFTKTIPATKYDWVTDQKVVGATKHILIFLRNNCQVISGFF